MYIGSVLIENPVILAPMAGVTDLPFRIIVKEMNCGLVYTEMVSDKGLIYSNERTFDLLKTDERERPVAVQIFGSEPHTMVKAARIVEQAGADIIDINMGCPTPKIVKNGEGSALMRNPQKAYSIMAAVVEAVKVPVSVKIRKGWDDESVNAVQIAKLAEQAGIASIAVHGRTREQFYAGKADWDIIAQVKQSITIPVIGNGDIRTPQDAQTMLDYTHCDAIMVGRALQGNPWLIAQISHYLKYGKMLPSPGIEEKFSMVLRHLAMLIAAKGEYIGIREMRRHAAWYTKGLPCSAEYRLRFNNAETREAFSAIISDFKQELLRIGCEGNASDITCC